MIPIYQDNEAFVQLKQLATPVYGDDTARTQTVQTIIRQVKDDGDQALADLAQRFGDASLQVLTLADPQVQEAVQRVSAETKTVMQRAAEHIRAFAQAVVDNLNPFSIQHPEFSVGMTYAPVQTAVCYVPGGRYPLPSTALMTAVTAKTAGVQRIFLTSPTLPDEVLYAASLAGVERIFRLGGAQAVAAFAFGTASVPRADMLVGPGNAYVTEAKRQLQGVIGIDMLAGPSEVAIIADGGANPKWIALDLLAQAEHDPEARVYLLTDSLEMATAVEEQMTEALNRLDLPAFVHEVVQQSGIFVLPDLSACVDASNRMAPEHLELHVANPSAIKPALIHYGALFEGYTASVPFGDYLAGPNHTLPTARTARFSGGLSPLTFLRPQSWIRPSDHCPQLASDTAYFAQLEGLTAHADAAKARLD